MSMNNPFQPESGLPRRTLPSRISNAHGERSLGELTRARLEEQRRLAKQLYQGLAHKIITTTKLMEELHGDLAAEGHRLTLEAEQILLLVEKTVKDLHFMVKTLDPNFQVPDESQEATQSPPHGHRYRIVGERVSDKSDSTQSKRLFAL